MAVADVQLGFGSGGGPETLPQAFDTYLEVGPNNVHLTTLFPANPRFHGMAVLTAGYMGTESSYKGLVKGMADLDYAVAFVDPPRQDDRPIGSRFHDPQQVHVDALEAVDAFLQTNWEEIADKAPNSEQIDFANPWLMAPHSMSGKSAINFAYHNRERVEAIVFLQALGVGATVLKDLLARPVNIVEAIGCAVHEFRPAAKKGHIDLSWQGAIEEARYIIGSLSQTAFEGIDCLRDPIHPQLQTIRDRGTKTAYLAAGHDWVVRPHKRMDKNVDYHKVMHNMGHFGEQAKPDQVALEIVQAHDVLVGPHLRSV